MVVTPETIVSYVRDAERRAVKTRTDARDVTKNRIVVRTYGVEKERTGVVLRKTALMIRWEDRPVALRPVRTQRGRTRSPTTAAWS